MTFCPRLTFSIDFYNSIQEHSDLIGDELNAVVSYFDDTQYDTELVEVSSSFRGNPALQSGEDVIDDKFND